MSLTSEEITGALRKLGVRQGDILCVWSDITKILAQIDERPAKTLLDGFVQAVGESGTILVPTFTRTSMIWAKKKCPDFTPRTLPYTGMFPMMIMRTPGAIRSTHPTHSFAALGPHAAALLKDHGPGSSCFEPFRVLVEEDGLMVSIDIPDVPGMPSIHLAQYELGLSQRHWLRFFQRCSYVDADGVDRIYRPIESPGCGAGFGKMYRNYAKTQNLYTTSLGRSWCIASRAREAYQEERKTLEQNPRYPLCDSLSCVSCRLLRGYNKRAIPMAILAQFLKQSRRLLSRTKR